MLLVESEVRRNVPMGCISNGEGIENNRGLVAF